MKTIDKNLKSSHALLIGLGAGALIVGIAWIIVVYYRKQITSALSSSSLLAARYDGTPGAPIQIAVFNQSTVVTQNDFINTTAAIQTQISRDFTPVTDTLYID
jgi:hypothetical protein